MLLLADAAAQFDPSTLTPAVSSVLSLGFAVWYAWYTVCYVLPGMQKEHREAMRDAMATHADTIKSMLTELKESRDAHDRWRMSQH
jgi:hypothetical protein